MEEKAVEEKAVKEKAVEEKAIEEKASEEKGVREPTCHLAFWWPVPPANPPSSVLWTK